MSIIFEKSKMLTDTPFHYCPGCSHGIAHRLIAEVIEEMGEANNVIGVAPVGCAVFAYRYFNCDMQQAAHGRAPAVATGIKRVRPDVTVFAYQGDGDLASIGLAEIVHAASRGEKFTVIFINNAIYGMTGGQMAPTTLEGQKASTCVYGRKLESDGNPIKMCEMLATLSGPAFIERCSLHDAPSIRKAKKAIRKAFDCQKAKKGFSFVELLCTCPTNWGVSPEKALEFVKNDMQKKYPLGNFREVNA